MTGTPEEHGSGWYCGADRSKKGLGPCELRAGWGTDHVGVGPCRKHGGATRNHRKAGIRWKSEQALAALGRPKEGADAQVELLGMVAEAAGNVLTLRQWVEDLGDDVYGPLFFESGQPSGRAEEHVLARMYGAWCDRLVHYSATAIKAGIAERTVKIQEALATLVMRFALALLDDPELGLSRDQRESGRRIAGRHLRSLGTAEDVA